MCLCLQLSSAFVEGIYCKNHFGCCIKNWLIYFCMYVYLNAFNFIPVVHVSKLHNTDLRSFFVGNMSYCILNPCTCRVHVFVCIYDICAPMWMGTLRLTLVIFLDCSPPYMFMQRFWLNSELTFSQSNKPNCLRIPSLLPTCSDCLWAASACVLRIQIQCSFLYG